MEWVGWRFVHNEYTVMGNDPWPRGIRPSARSSARRVSFDVGVSWQRFKEFSHSLPPESRMSRHGRTLSYLILSYSSKVCRPYAAWCPAVYILYVYMHHISSYTVCICIQYTYYSYDICIHSF